MSLFSFIANFFIGTMLGIVALLGTYHASYQTPPAQPTIQKMPAATSSAQSLSPSSVTASSSSTIPSKKTITSQTVAPITITPQQQTAVTSLLEPEQATAAEVEAVNTELRGALVNILCTTGGGGYLNPISGSGVFIDTRGIILTNAHVGQFFLLRDYPTQGNVDCVVRTGSPATAEYNAQLLYLPPAWIDANASQINSSEAMGTGENDYAFLLVTSRVDGSSLPSSFPALTFTTNPPDIGDELVLAAYPAQYLGGNTIEQNLYASSAVTTVDALYTFNSPNTIDAISLGSSIVSQSGSSGGAVANAQDGTLLGIISTQTQGTTTASRELRAITLGHINRSLNSFGQGSIANLLTGDVESKASDYNLQTAPLLTQKLEDALK